LDLICYIICDSSLGNIVLISKNGRIVELDITQEDEYKIKKRLSGKYPQGIESQTQFKGVLNQLNRYLQGEKTDFNAKVDLSRLGNFAERVLLETRKIPYGQVRSYAWLGRMLGYKNASRAVGQALKKNPVPIIIPCHRVIREDGSIGGFSMGIGMKKRLLSIEGIRDIR